MRCWTPYTAKVSIRRRDNGKGYEEYLRVTEREESALRTEYRSIVDAGFLLQVDDARAAVTYDRMVPPAASNPDVQLMTPGFFDVVSDVVQVRGTAAGEGLASFGLQTGEGLDPQAWLQIGTNQGIPVHDGALGRWDTTGLQGVYILRLTVVHDDGSVTIAAVPLTVDNRPPEVDVVLPAQGASFDARTDHEVPIQVEASDETRLARVVIYVDGRPVETRTGAPWSVRWPLGEAGDHTIRARAYDVAGNWADAAEVTFAVVR